MKGNEAELWRALGELVGKSLAGKKAVLVPHFGTFTLTSAPVSLEGVTNPAKRERDDREAVFLVASDFAPNLRPGIAHSTGVRPYTAKGFSGKVPTLTLNFTELARIAKIEKAVCKRNFEQSVRELAATAKLNQDIRKSIPGLGTFVVKSGIAAVIFDNSSLQSLSNTGKTAVNRSESPLFEKITAFGETIERPFTTLTKSEDSSHRSMNVKALLTSPVDFLVDNRAKALLLLQLKDQSNAGALTVEELSQCLQGLENPALTGELIRHLADITRSKTGSKVRYRDLFAGIERLKTPKPQGSFHSDITANYSRTAIVPLARQVWHCKGTLTDLAQRGGMRPRVRGTASELLSLLKRANVNVNIHQLKAFIREDQLNPASISVLDLIAAARSVLKPEVADLSVFSGLLSQHSPAPVRSNEPDKLDRFFRSHPLTEVFFKARNEADIVTLPAFLSVLHTLSKGLVQGFEAQRAFLQASKGKTELTAAEFWSAFQPSETPKQVEERCFRILRQWLRDEEMTSEQAFQRLLDKVGASEQLSKGQFEQAVSSFALSKGDVGSLFEALDGKKDGVVDLAEWLNKIYEQEGPYQPLKDVFYRANIPQEDLITQLGLQDRLSLSEKDLISLLQRLDASLSLQKAMSITSSVLRNRSEIPVSELFSQLSSSPRQLTGDWLDQLYQRIRKRLSGQSQRLRSLFEAADLKRAGRLSPLTFQNCLLTADLGLQPLEIQRLLQILDPRDVRVIDYCAFVDNLTGPEYVPVDPLRETTQRLQVYMRQNGLTEEQLCETLGGYAPILTFAHFLRSKVHQRLSAPEMAEIVSKMDLNRDGQIDSEDLKAVFSTRNIVAIEGKSDQNSANLTTEQARSLLTRIQDSLSQQKISFAEAFKRLDADRNGTIAYSDFMTHWDSLYPLSHMQKEGLFRLFDSQNIGQIDYPSFLRILRDVEIDPKASSENWDWEHDVISKIKAWKAGQKLPTEAVFRAFDRDFDGILSKTDLTESLDRLLKLGNLPSAKVERVYKLLDVFQRGSVQLADFKVILDENCRPEWKSRAKQQLSLCLSQAYPSLSEAFERVSEHTGKVTFAQFKATVEAKDWLKGFGLTVGLLQELFASLDQGRKGYISESDWRTAFGDYERNKLFLREFVETLKANFSSLESAFDYFLSFHASQPPGKILLSEFESALESLLPKRFTKADAKVLWQSIAHDRSYIDYSSFTAIGPISFTSPEASKPPVHTKRPSLKSFTQSKLAVLTQDDPFRRLNSLLRTSSKPLEQVFREIDTQNSGQITESQFRAALRGLNLGLSSVEIDQLVLRSDLAGQNCINWVTFMRKFTPTETERHLKALISNRLEKLRQDMWRYMGSPREAFRRFEKERSGKLEFAAFTALIRALYTASGEALPAFSVLKDLFDSVDSRKDGYLDIKEWLSAFKQEIDQNSWEFSRSFDEIAKIIVKNSKMLQMTFEAMSKNGLVTLQSAKDVLSTVLKEANLTEEQWILVLKPGKKDENVDFRQLLNTYRARKLGKSQFS